MAKIVGNVTGQANDITVATGSGVIDGDTQRMVLATDQPVIPVSDNGASLTVDNTVLSVVGGGTEATAQRVTIASDSTGVLSVDDNGASLTVDGTVAATQSGTWTVQPGNTANTTAWKVDGSAVTQPVSAASLPLPSGAGTSANQTTIIGHVDGIEALLGTIDTDTGVLAGAVSGSEMQVDVVTLPTVTLAAGTNTNEVVGDVAEDAALAGNPVRVGVRASAARPTSMSTDGDVVTPAADLSGQQYVIPGRVATATLANVASSATNVTVLAANTSRKGVIIYNDSTQVLYLKYGATASATSFTYYIAAAAHWEMPSPLFTGQLDGLWGSANGNARVTETSA